MPKIQIKPLRCGKFSLLSLSRCSSTQRFDSDRTELGICHSNDRIKNEGSIAGWGVLSRRDDQFQILDDLNSQSLTFR